MSAPENVRNWQSVRTVLEGLILLGVCYLASSIQDQMKATIRLEAQMAAMTGQFVTLQTQLADLPSLSRNQARTDVKLEEHERRISTLESIPPRH